MERILKVWMEGNQSFIIKMTSREDGNQLPLFMVIKEWWLDGELEFAEVLFKID